MNIYNFLTLIGGLSIFLFGMSVMGQALERKAGDRLRTILEKLTSSKIKGLLTGIVVTAIVQSSSATTVMVVGFVNSGLMTLRQSIHIIMGANIGTTVTAWILSLSGLSGDNMFIKMLKPSSFSPIFAFLGIIFYLFLSNSKKKDTGLIFLGFATLMFGMQTMSHAVSGLRDVEEFKNMLLLFQNPLLGVLAGAVLTAVLQSSSASVGILQALASTGQVTVGASIPIIMGQNIGTCVTALLSSIGANKNAKRAAFIHLAFNLIGTVTALTIYWIVRITVMPTILNSTATLADIAIVHTAFNLFCTLMLLPMAGLLDKMAHAVIKDSDQKEAKELLDDRLLSTPPIALEVCRNATMGMAKKSINALKQSMNSIYDPTKKVSDLIRSTEDKTDKLEDELGTYLVRLSSLQISDHDSAEAAELLKLIGDYERIADHAVNILVAAEEKKAKKISFTDAADEELKVMSAAVAEILDISYEAFINNDYEKAHAVGPLEQVIDNLKDQLRTNHIIRLQKGLCTIEAGFIWSDMLTSLERVSDHCSNIAWGIIGIGMTDHTEYESMHHNKIASSEYQKNYINFSNKYSIAAIKAN